MRLWHYTGKEHVEGIQRQGILGGSLFWPTARGYQRLADLQWLTDSDSWTQGWATRELVHCDRTEARFRVAIPKSQSAALLYPWRAFAWKLGLPRQEVEWFAEAGGGGDEHWYVFLGGIPRGWLRGLELRPSEVLA
jgi:hypothetical protein